MSIRAGEIMMDVRGRQMFVAIAMSVALFGATTAAWPQQSQTQAPAAPPAQDAAPADQAAAAPEPPARGNPGLVEEIGKLLKGTPSSLTPSLPSPLQTIDGLNSSAKKATDSLSRIAPLSGQSVVVGRTMCIVASNGAPDCKSASDQLCREKGYKEGRSLDIEAAQKCSAKAYFSGGSACKTENFVTRAVCQ
ncbi:hypothetical protein V1291_002145 [Nitrobacteraceae bacterium AZCC 1564]